MKYSVHLYCRPNNCVFWYPAVEPIEAISGEQAIEIAKATDWGMEVDFDNATAEPHHE